MSLHFPLRVGLTTIGYFEAVRIEGDDSPGSINTYRCGVHRPDRGRLNFTLRHRYGDGAWALVHAATERIIAFDRGEA
ncbi:MAG: hypothetical protein QM662_08600 [Gordonia sp. (in: high G+C Gram-positive bacteria)]